jgi:hypothetical protein
VDTETVIQETVLTYETLFSNASLTHDLVVFYDFVALLLLRKLDEVSYSLLGDFSPFSLLAPPVPCVDIGLLFLFKHPLFVIQPMFLLEDTLTVVQKDLIQKSMHPALVSAKNILHPFAFLVLSHTVLPHKRCVTDIGGALLNIFVPASDDPKEETEDQPGTATKETTILRLMLFSQKRQRLQGRTRG